MIEEYKPFVYPDGTLEILCDGDETADQVYNYLPVYAAIHQSLHFRNLMGFPLRRHYLIYRQSYEEKMRDVGIGLGVSVLDVFPGEWNKQHLQFTVLFHRKPKTFTVQAFVDHYSAFFRRVKDHGIDSEGPLFLVRPIVKLLGVRAEMWLNASRTGPRTLVWILLEAFGFGHDVALIEGALFNQDDEVCIEQSLRGAKRASLITGIPWTNEYERRFLGDGLGGFGEKEIELPLTIE